MNQVACGSVNLWKVGVSAGAGMVKEAGAQNVMHVKLGCRQNWVERILNSNHLLPPSWEGGSSLTLH